MAENLREGKTLPRVMCVSVALGLHVKSMPFSSSAGAVQKSQSGIILSGNSQYPHSDYDCPALVASDQFANNLGCAVIGFENNTSSWFDHRFVGRSRAPFSTHTNLVRDNDYQDD